MKQTIFLAPWGESWASDGPHTILAAGNRMGHYYPRIAELPVATNDTNKALDNITEALLNQRSYVVLGGEHTITLAILRARSASGCPPHLIMFDAHTDEYGGSTINCGNWLTAAKREKVVSGVTWFNYRDGDIPDIPVADRYHISIDIDVLSPNEYAWATNYPALGGCTLGELVDVVSAFAGGDITADLVEYQPSLDTSNRIGGRACAVILDTLLGVVH